MSGYFKTTLGVRVIASSLMGVVSVIGTFAITFLALALVDAGSDLSFANALGLLFGALFGAALVITRAFTEAPRGWAAFFVGLGACAGVLLTELLVRTLGYPFTRDTDGMALCFVLTSLGAFVGTHGGNRRRNPTTAGDPHSRNGIQDGAGAREVPGLARPVVAVPH